MADGEGPIDPFGEDDPAAAEREARRRAREQRRAKGPRRDGGEGARRSLGERVSGALGGLGGSTEASSAGPQRPEPPDDPPPERPPAPIEPSEEIAETEEPAPQPAADSREFFALPRESAEGNGQGSGNGGLGGEIMRRRLMAGIAVIGVIVVIVVIAKAAGGGDPEPTETVAAEPAAKTTSLTIPEGLTLSQIDELAKEAKLKGNYEKAAEKPPKGFPVGRYGAEDTPSLEGFLFPATYELEFLINWMSGVIARFGVMWNR